MKENRQNGILIGLVDSLDDPDDLGRVLVKYPYLEDKKSDWARIVSFMGGADRGSRFIPEKKDEVLVAFEQGDPRRPYILGSVWSKVDKPPAHDGDKKKNNWRYIKSRSGHIIRFDDTLNSEKLEFIDKDNKHKITIDTSGDKIEIVCDSGNVEIKAESGNVDISASTVNVKSKQDMTLEATGNMTIKGAKVDIN